MIKIEYIFNNYQKVMDDLFDEISKDFKCRHDVVQLQLSEDNIIDIKKNHLLTNIALWYPFFSIDADRFTEDYIIDFNEHPIINDLLFEYFDRLIVLFQDNFKELNLAISETLSLLDSISRKFNPYMGNSISLHSLIKLAKNEKEIDDLFHFKLDENNQSSENEQIIEGATKRLVSLMKKNENCIQDFLNCGEGINVGQLSQMILSSGYKSDLSGKVYPVPINTNLLRGFRNISDYVLDASAGRKSMVITYNQVKKSGYMTRKLSLLCIDTVLSTTTDDCGTTAYVNTYIPDKGILNKLKNRWYDRGDGILELITPNSTELIGTTIKLRSPMTCKCKDGICKTCYGKLSELNKDIHIGLFATQLLTAQLTQMLLSSKHLLKTNSEKIELSEEFNKYFQLSGNLIYKNEDFQYLVISEDNLKEEDEEDIQDDDVDTELGKLGVSKFKICNKKRNVIAEFEENKTLYLSEELLALLKSAKKENGEYILNLKNWNFEDILFYIDIQNKELSSTLDKVIKLIDSKENLGVTNYHELLNKFLELTPEAKLKPDSVHIEIILRELIRSAKNKTERPDFEANEDYVILRATEAILHSSLVVSLSFEHFKRQINDVTTYSKDKHSFLEPMFN